MLDIIIDTREQTPWGFSPDEATVERGKLDYGDYALRGDGGFAIERKSLNDYCGTVGIEKNWERFQREIERANNAGCNPLPIIVEGNWEDFLFSIDGNRIVPPTHSHPGFSPSFALKRLLELSAKKYGAVVHWASNPNAAQVLAYGLLALRKHELEHNNE